MEQTTYWIEMVGWMNHGLDWCIRTSEDALSRQSDYRDPGHITDQRLLRVWGCSVLGSGGVPSWVLDSWVLSPGPSIMMTMIHDEVAARAATCQGLRRNQPAGEESATLDRARMGLRDCGPLPCKAPRGGWGERSERSEIGTEHGAGPGLRQSGMHVAVMSRNDVAEFIILRLCETCNGHLTTSGEAIDRSKPRRRRVVRCCHGARPRKTPVSLSVRFAPRQLEVSDLP